MPADPGDAPGDRPPAAAVRDRAAAVGAVLGFSFSLGSASLILPLLALASGYDPATIGILTAISAVSQLALRLQLPAILAIVPDRTMIVAANGMMVASFALLLVSREIPAFVVAQLLQGGARAMFWTASQTHAVRSRDGVVRSLVIVQVVGNVGAFAGPAAAGIVAAGSLDSSLVLASAAGVVGLVAGLLMLRLAPYPKLRRGHGPRIWRRPGVDLACWAGYSAGGWRAMLSSFVPVALTAAGQAPEVVGALLAATEAAAMAPAGFLLRRRTPNIRRAIEIGVLVVTISLGILPAVVASAPLAGLVLVLGGVGSGLLMSLGPALASQSVGPEEQGEAIAVAGTFRAGALLITPAAVSAALTVVALPTGMVVAAFAIGGPALAAAASRSRAAAASA
jgi:MFS family permease